jgi:hypothetical protein
VKVTCAQNYLRSKHLLSEMHFKSISATPAKTGFSRYFFHSEGKNRRGGIITRQRK